LLRTNKPLTREVPADIHPNPPFVPKKVFTELGDLIKVAERPETDRIGGSKWISLRLDGKGFGKYVRNLQRLGVFGSNGGYSKEFASIMQECVTALMEEFSAICGYTQSDEMTVLIPAASIVREVQQPHAFNGRVQKIGTLAASVVTGIFNLRVTEMCVKLKIKVEPKSMLARFDCRVGNYDSEREATSVLLWRAYDCGVNGVSDAVHKAKDIDAKKVEITRRKATLLDTGSKLKWLNAAGLLPLPAHQSKGSFYVKVKREKTAYNPQLKKEVTCMRSTLIKVDDKHILELAAATFPSSPSSGGNSPASLIPR